MNTKDKLLEHVRKIIKNTDDKDVRYIGPKPWYLRTLNKFKLGLAIGIATGMVSGFTALGVFEQDLVESVEKSTPVASGTIKFEHHAQLTPIKKISIAETLEKFRAEHPDIDFTDIKNARQVAKEFLGKNSYISLCAEMEGFRGDLHLDPATGLNIGFGYNISKRAATNPDVVREDLKSIGMKDDIIERIIKISQVPQKKLRKEIKKFNEDLNLPNNQLITLEQGVALVMRIQNEYKAQAREAFEASFDKMDSHQQEVLTYAAYKAGYEALSKYKKAIKTADKVYANNKEPGINQLKSIAKELTFYYAKDGGEMVLDERATLIAHTFVSPDYLGLQIGKKDDLKQSPQKLYQQQIDFSHLETTLDKKKTTKVDLSKKKNAKINVSATLNKYRKHSPQYNSHKKHNSV